MFWSVLVVLLSQHAMDSHALNGLDVYQNTLSCTSDLVQQYLGNDNLDR